MKININIRNGNVISPFGGRNRNNSDRINDKIFLSHSKKCFYCKRKVSIGYEATADHIYSKNDIRRALSNKTVLCCFNCNQQRNNKEVWDNKKSYYLLQFPVLSKYSDDDYRGWLFSNNKSYELSMAWGGGN